MNKLALAMSLFAVGCARVQTSQVQSQEVPPAPMETFRDLKPGERLQLITPLRRENPQAPWKFGLSNTTVTTEGSQVTGIAIQVRLDSEAQFAFERTEYRVEAEGLAWVSSVVHFNGQESATKAPVLQILPAKGPKRFLRLLYLTRRSDRDNDAALLSASRREDLGESCEQAKPAATCHLIPRGVALSVQP